MRMCREYNNSFYADADSREEQLGLPGRVFLNKLPESTPDVKYYTLKEYPQRDLALRCEIESSWALPVFEHSSRTCVGVLEIVSPYGIYRHDKEFLGRVYDIFQEFGLRCFDGYEHCKMQYWDKNEAPTAAFQELKMVYKVVCIIHNLPFALSWVSCHSGNDLLQSQFQFSILDYSTDKKDYDDFLAFANVSKACLLKKGQVTGRILPFPNLLYCSDVKQFSIAEFPLVPYARWCELGGWFTMCIQSGYTGDELYVLEFFLPKSTENDENILTKLRLILGTMEKNFETFKLASGQGLGEALSVEVIDFQNGQKSHSIQMIPASRCIPGLELLQDGGVMLQQDQQDQPSMDVINSGMYVVSEAQNYNLPILDSLQNGKVTKQVDSSDQHCFNPSFHVLRFQIQASSTFHCLLHTQEPKYSHARAMEGNLQVENRSMTNSSARDDKLYDSAYSLVENENKSYVNRVLIEFNASITSNDSPVLDHHPSTPEHSLRGTSEWEEAVKSFLGYPVLVCGMQHQEQLKQKTLDQIGKAHSPYLNLDEFRNITRQEKGGIASNRLANITNRLEPDGTSYNYASATKGAKVVAHNKEAKGASNILGKDHDKYLRNPCSVGGKFIIIELAEETLVDTVKIANFEHYSSNFKEFELYGSLIYPTETWSPIGKFVAANAKNAHFITFSVVFSTAHLYCLTVITPLLHSGLMCSLM
ncbi:hypothetical protein RHGRI_006037 [Rhododendron griersonianum]|uniref:SUN domain-containing protein n=1 Tax=Rhododendron griersonianum TaxID=479676 RepID=A0AAV6LGJ2_9ERIC|nr:hypothetical protein RHGRI_006037 [Rhododendron griersonianum]